MMLKVLENLRRFDAYPKTVEDFRVKTYIGASLSILSGIAMVVLFYTEYINYTTADITEDLFVDTSRNPDININLDIVVPTISCDFLALDAMDSSGEQHLQIDHDIYKRRLDLNGNPIAEPKREDITIKTKTLNETETTGTNKTECGSCYGASDGCCRTCEDVREAYRLKKWAFPDNPQNITQCKDEKFIEKLKDAFNQGCNIYGALKVNRVSGSFHIAPGKSFSINHVHVHDVQPFSSTSFNTTHVINLLTFGAHIESEMHNPLKNAVGLAEEGATMFQYYLKIVPTSFAKKDGTIVESYQFSVTKHQKVVSIMNGESGMPGIFFQYELSPLMVKYTEKERSLGHFLTNICAIIGGVYTVASLFDRFLYHSVQFVQKKLI